MKKMITLLVTCAMVLTLAACSSEPAPTTAAETKTEAETSLTEATSGTESTSALPEQEGQGTVSWPESGSLHVGYSQADLASTWRTVESDDMQSAADERGIKITIVNAQGDAEKQISDVESLLAQGCNVIVITAIDADGIQPALDACKAKKVPVLMKSRGSNGTPGVDYVTFVASDFVKEGSMAAEWAGKACEEKGIETIKVAEIQGIIGGTDVRDRSQGFHDVAEKKGNFEFVAQQPANFSRTEAQEVASNLLQSTGGDIDVFYCHNDEMALGVSLACQSAGLKINEDVFVIGVDGMKESLDAIKNGQQSATITCTPKFASLVFDKIEAGIKGEALESYYPVEDATVDAANVDQYYDLSF